MPVYPGALRIADQQDTILEEADHLSDMRVSQKKPVVFRFLCK